MTSVGIHKRLFRFTIDWNVFCRSQKARQGFLTQLEHLNRHSFILFVFEWKSNQTRWDDWMSLPHRSLFSATGREVKRRLARSLVVPKLLRKIKFSNQRRFTHNIRLYILPNPRKTFHTAFHDISFLIFFIRLQISSHAQAGVRSVITAKRTWEKLSQQIFVGFSCAHIARRARFHI